MPVWPYHPSPFGYLSLSNEFGLFPLLLFKILDVVCFNCPASAYSALSFAINLLYINFKLRVTHYCFLCLRKNSFYPWKQVLNSLLLYLKQCNGVPLFTLFWALMREERIPSCRDFTYEMHSAHCDVKLQTKRTYNKPQSPLFISNLVWFIIFFPATRLWSCLRTTTVALLKKCILNVTDDCHYLLCDRADLVKKFGICEDHLNQKGKCMQS